MIDDIKLLLGNDIITVVLDDDTIHAAISMASQHYLRYRPNTPPDWGTSPRAYSWIMEYALAYCKLIMGEHTDPHTSLIPGIDLIQTAMVFMTNLERELITYP